MRTRDTNIDLGGGGHEKEKEKESNTDGEVSVTFVSKARIVHRVGARSLYKLKTNV